MAYKQPVQAVKRTIATSDTALQSDNEGPKSLMVERHVPASAPDHSKINLLVWPQVRKMMRHMGREEGERIHASHVDPFLYKVSEKEIFAVFLAGSDAATDGLRTSSYHFVMHTLTETAITSGLDKTFDRNIERWAKSPTFMDTSVQRAFTSSQFVRPIAKFIK